MEATTKIITESLLSKLFVRDTGGRAAILVTVLDDEKKLHRRMTIYGVIWPKIPAQ